MGEFVRFSRHIQENPVYAMLANKVRIVPSTENVVNASAGIVDDKSEPPYLAVVFHRGYANATRLLSFAIGADREGFRNPNRFLLPAVLALGRHLVAANRRLTGAQTATVFKAAGLGETIFRDQVVIKRARSYSAAMNMMVFAHEFGHICYGHLGSSGDHEVSRNQERDADSFAYSLSAKGPFAEFAIEGYVLNTLLDIWIEKVAGPTVATTHPFSRERLSNFLRSHPKQCADLGISEEGLEPFLPPAS